jgi:subtilisin family serine protease
MNYKYLRAIFMIGALALIVTLGSKLDVNSPASQAYRTHLSEQRSAAIAQIAQEIGRSNINILYVYDVAYNGMAVELSPAEAATVARLPEVKRVIRNFQRYIQTDTTPEFLNAYGVWDGSNVPPSLPGTLGEGMVVGIIDTGINMGHPSFAATDGDGYTHTNPRPGYYGWCDPAHPNYDPSLVCNDKLIGVYAYPTSGMNPIDANGHGSHVGGTAAGNVLYDIEYNAVTFDRISGIAPRANIISYRVCLTTSCDLDAILAAIDDATADAVDVINYSIGGGPTDPWNDPDSEAYLNARDAGIFVATSAGNSGPNPGTIGSPANSPWITAVGNTTIGRIIANTLDVTGPAPVPPALEGIAAVRGSESPPISSDIEADIIYSGDVDPDNILGCDPFPAGSFTGSIALIQRGVCPFSDKINNANAAGAIAVVIFNNAGGPPIVMSVAGTSIHSVFVSDADGIAIRNWIQAETDPTASINAGTTSVNNPNWADIMANLSSRGPNVNPDFIKPDIAAPGTNILAPYAGAANSYGMISGTSMASPHVAGAATLLRSLFPDWSPAEIQSALMMTSLSGVVVKQDVVTPSDPFDVGAGRLDLTNAALAGLVLHETTANFEAADPALGGDPTTLNLASLANFNCLEVCSWTRTVRSVADSSITYNATSTGPVGMAITVDPPSFTIDPDATQVLTITVDASAMPFGSWAFAEVQLTPQAAANELLNESFTDATFPPTGWTTYKLQGGGTEVWQRVTATSNSSPASAHRRWSGSADGFQDDWLVTPPITITLSAASLNFADRGLFMGDYVYSGVWISTASCDPADGDFVELAEIDDSINNVWRNVPAIGLSAYSGQSACLAFRYSGTFAHSWWIDDVVVEEFDLPAAIVHMPVTVRPVEASPVLSLNPTALEATQQPNMVTNDTLVIGNTGGLPLDWSLIEIAPTTVITTVLWNQPVNGSGGIISDYFTGSNGGVYSADDFELLLDATVNVIFTPGFWNAGDINNATMLNWYIYADDNGKPAGHPEDGLNLEVWSYSAAPGSPGITILSNDVTLDLVEAAGAGVDLSAGHYWLSFYPTITPAFGANRWNWFQGTPLLTSAQLVDPNNFFNLGATNWTAFGALGVSFSGVSFTLEGTVSCESGNIPWLTLDPMSGQVDPESAQNVSVTFDSIGLEAGEYSSVLCLLTNDPENELVVIPASLTVEAGAEIVVDPTELSSMQLQNSVVTETLTISNMGIADLEWEIEEENTSAGLLTTELLYDQTGNITTSGVLAIYDLDEEPNWVVQAADDFVVPEGEVWNVHTVYAGGFYQAFSSLPGGVNVFFYEDNGGLPGDELYAYSALTPASDVGGNLTLDLPLPAVLTEGTYWVSVQPRMDYFAHGRWFWYAQSVQTNNEFAWRNPTNSYGTGCSSWGYSSDCGFAQPDLTFQLVGERIGDCSDLSEITWLSVNPASGTTAPEGSDDVTVTFDATGLLAGVYTGNLCVFSNDPDTPVVVVPVEMTVEEKAWLQVAHLAPFAADASVTVLVNGAPALTDFNYGDSTGYIELPAGEYDIDIVPTGAMDPAISATVELMGNTYYSAIAYGDGANQALGLMLLVDDNTAPAAGKFHLRLGHLAPFAAGPATADIRLQDGTLVVGNVDFGDVTGYIELDAGTYDLKITTPGGGTTLIDPLPVTFGEGDIITAFATGEGSNQPLGVFAWPPDAEGFFLPLAPTVFNLYLPIIVR